MPMSPPFSFHKESRHGVYVVGEAVSAERTRASAGPCRCRRGRSWNGRRGARADGPLVVAVSLGRSEQRSKRQQTTWAHSTCLFVYLFITLPFGTFARTHVRPNLTPPAPGSVPKKTSSSYSRSSCSAPLASVSVSIGGVPARCRHGETCQPQRPRALRCRPSRFAPC